MEATDEFVCVNRSRQGRVLHCPGLGRLVVDFKGSYFVFRPCEFQRFRYHFTRMVACPWSRCQLQAGEQIAVRDSAGRNTLTLNFSEVEELADLMEAAALLLEAGGFIEGCGVVNA